MADLLTTTTNESTRLNSAGAEAAVLSLGLVLALISDTQWAFT